MGVVANSYAGKHFTMYQINTSYTSHLHDVTMLRANYISVTGGGGHLQMARPGAGPSGWQGSKQNTDHTCKVCLGAAFYRNRAQLA